MDNYLTHEALENLQKYSTNLYRFSQIESALVRSAHELNQLVTDLYVGQRTEALKSLSDILLMGFMQYSVHSLYLKSYSLMPYGSKPSEMINRLDAHSLDTLKQQGLTDKHIAHIREYNRSMSAIVEGIVNYEKVYHGLSLQIDHLSQTHGSDFDQALITFINEQFSGIPSVVYLKAQERATGKHITPESYVGTYGAIPVGYRYFLNTSNQKM